MMDYKITDKNVMDEAVAVVCAAWAPICACFLRQLVRRRGGLERRAEPRDRGYAFCRVLKRYDARLYLHSFSLTRLAAA